MAEWPANGVTDWNTKSKAFIDVEHNTDGTHAIKWPVDSVDTRIYTKYFTGTTDNDASTSVAHGITGVDNILSVVAMVGTSASAYAVGELFANAQEATAGTSVNYDGTNIIIGTPGTTPRNKKYRIKIDYIL